METFTVVKDKFSPFVRELLESEPRFRFHDIGNDAFDDKKIFVVTKEIIHTSYLLPAIEHEIAHAVEMKDKSRWCVPDWGLTFEDFSNGKMMKPSRFFASMAREIRVRAIQLHMSPAYRNEVNSSLYNILNNEHAWGGDYTKRFLPYGRFKSYTDVQAWVHDLRVKSYNAWSLDRIRHEWSIRLEHMQNWMETFRFITHSQ